ncbi:hypothetical protein BGZ76_002212 [Entomortierella beljakovae]|nr:hypothetical protein BGZ76_002212 [Entomortierella beljakovae]
MPHENTRKSSEYESTPREYRSTHHKDGSTPRENRTITPADSSVLERNSMPTHKLKRKGKPTNSPLANFNELNEEINGMINSLNNKSKPRRKHIDKYGSQLIDEYGDPILDGFTQVA